MGRWGEGLLRLSPSRWASFRAFGIITALPGHGVGFSGVAEPYFNFGYICVVLFFVGLGVMSGRLDSLNILLNYPWLLITSLTLWHFVVTVRNDFQNFTKPAAFTLMIAAIWLFVGRFTAFVRP